MGERSVNRDFVDICPLPILRVGKMGDILFANSSAADVLNLQSFNAAELRTAKLGRDVGANDLRCSLRCPDGEMREFTYSSFGADEHSDWMILIHANNAAIDATEALRETSTQLRSLIEMLPQGMCVFDADDRYVLWNQKYSDMYPDIANYLRQGVSFEEILRISLANGEMAEYVDEPESWLRERLYKHSLPSSQEEQELSDGRWVRHDDRRIPGGGAIGMRIDISDLKRREEWLDQLFHANPMPMLLCDVSSLLIVDANAAASSFYGFEHETLLTKTAYAMHVEEEAGAFAEVLHAITDSIDSRTIWTQQTVDNSVRHVLICVKVMRDAQKRRLLLAITDVTDRILAEAQAVHLAYHDALTGLPNRMSFNSTLEDALKSATTADMVAVHYLDLDGFKPVNDTFGHGIGDGALRTVAERLKEAAGEDIFVARLAGDEFCIIQLGDLESIALLAERCIDKVRAPMVLAGISVSIGLSVGISIAPLHGITADELMISADGALYIAKGEGRNTWRVATVSTLVNVARNANISVS